MQLAAGLLTKSCSKNQADLFGLIMMEAQNNARLSLPPEPEPETPSPQSIWEKHRKQRTGTSQRKQAPTR